MKLKLVSALSLLSLLLCFSSVSGKNIEEEKWRRMESQNFVIYSTFNRPDSKKILERLEAVNAIFLGTTGKSVASQVPTTMFAVEHRKQMDELGLDARYIAGFFRPGLRRNIVGVRGGSGTSAGKTAVHEYVHYLLFSNSAFPFPAWYHEGYAEYVSSGYLSNHKFEIGKIDPFYARRLDAGLGKWLPMEKIVDSSHLRSFDELERSLFYAQSWALVHYLHSRPNGQRLLHDNLVKYAQSLQAGNPELVAFEEAFDLEIGDLELILKRYMASKQHQFIRFKLGELLKDFDPVETGVTTEEVSAELGFLLVELERGSMNPDASRLQQARRLFDVAAASPATQARATMGIGQVLELKGEASEAESHIETGASSAPNDYDVQIDAARFYVLRLMKGDDDARNTAEPYLLKALNLDNTQPEVAYLLGMFLLHSGETDAAIRALESASQRAPAVPSLRLTLAHVYAFSGDTERAIKYAKDLLHFQHGYGNITNAAQQLIDRLQGESENAVAPQ